jgi:hypothetical protein
MQTRLWFVAALALVSPAISDTAIDPSENAEGGALNSALETLGAVINMAKEEVMTQVENIAWEDIINAATQTIGMCKHQADGYFEASEGELSNLYKKVNWTYVEEEAQKALALSVEAKEVATIFAQQTSEDGIKLTRKQVKFLSSEFVKLYAAINWTAIEELLEVSKEVAMTKPGEAALVIQAKTGDLAALAAERAAAAAEQAGPYVDQAKSKAVEVSPFLRSEPPPPARPQASLSPLAMLVPVALLVAAGLAWRARSGAAYQAAKAEGGEASQSML